MNAPRPSPTQAELAAQLARELAVLRDALVTLSLNLKDWQFEKDQVARAEAQQLAQQALDACSSRSAASNKYDKP